MRYMVLVPVLELWVVDYLEVCKTFTAYGVYSSDYSVDRPTWRKSARE